MKRRGLTSFIARVLNGTSPTSKSAANTLRLQRFSVCHPERSEGSTRSDPVSYGFAKVCIVAIHTLIGNML
jgi:hypothetical protein